MGKRIEAGDTCKDPHCAACDAGIEHAQTEEPPMTAIPEPLPKDWERNIESEWRKLELLRDEPWEPLWSITAAALRREAHYRKENAALRRLLGEALEEMNRYDTKRSVALRERIILTLTKGQHG